MAQVGRFPVIDYMAGPSRTLMQGLALHQRGKIAGRQQDIAEGGLAVRERQVGVSEEKLALEKSKIPVPERQFSAGEISQLKAMGGAIGKKLGFRLNTVTPIANAIEGYTKQGYNKIDVYRALKGDWGNLVKPAQESIQKAMETAIASNDQKTLGELTQLQDELSSDTFVDKMMPASAQYETAYKRSQMPKPSKGFEEALTKGYEGKKGGLEKIESLYKGKAKDSKTYDEPKIGPLGNLLQKETTTGKVSRVSGKPSKGAGAQAKSYVTWQLPDGTTKNLRLGETPPKGAVKYKDPRMTQKDVDTAEEKILGNPGDKRVIPHIRSFNRNSDASYYYMFDPGKKEGAIRSFFGSSDDKIVKIPLPVIKGHQATAKELYLTAKNHGKTIPQMLEILLKENNIKPTKVKK